MDTLRNLLFAILLITGTAYAGPTDDCQEYAKYGVPGKSGDLLCRKGFLLAHDPERKTPIWVVEHLTKVKVEGDISRSWSFKADPDLERGRRAELSDYKNSGFDRGHVAPAADMEWDAQAMAESFYLSNMVPQNGPMNRGGWKGLEESVRQWVLDRGELYIYTGSVYSPGGVPANIGKNKVAVPTHLYKIVFDPTKVEAIAFIMPNRDVDVSEMGKYVVSVRDVEAHTGLDFLSVLQTPVQDLVEKQKPKTLW